MQQPGCTTLHSGAFVSGQGLLIRLRSARRRMVMHDHCPNRVFRSAPLQHRQFDLPPITSCLTVAGYPGARPQLR
jgi:hypothetical protein